MRQKIERGKTLLVDGPASVRVVSGKVEMLGFPLKIARQIVVREGKRLPFLIVETADLDVSLGENATGEEVEGSTIPQSWINAVKVLRGFQKKPAVVMVVGKADSGKTSFCTYLVNSLVSSNYQVAVLDGDLGQADVGPPCTVAYAFVTKPLMELYDLKAQNAYFVGATSPSAAVNKAIEGMALMKAEISGMIADYVIVNTDGWVEGEDAAKYKLQLADVIKPNLIVCIQQETELDPLLVTLKKYEVMTAESSLAVKQRSMEKRKNLRELSYAKYLKDAKAKAFPLNRLTIEEKTALPARKKGEHRGLLLGFYDAHQRFLGIGVLREVDSARKTLKVLTSVSATPSRVVFGKVRLDENLRETAVTGENADTVS